MNSSLAAPGAQAFAHLDEERAGEGNSAQSLEEEVLTVDSSRILGGRQEVTILHNGRTYRLRCTRLGKLILTA